MLRALSQRDDIRAIEVGGGELVPRGTPRKKLLTARQDFVWYPWLGRRAAADAGADIYHCPTLRAPLTRGKPPLIITAHDLAPLRFPETMTRWSRLYGRATLRRALGAADMIVASSQDTADDLSSLMGISPDRIRVVWIGIDDVFFSPSTASAARDPYVLFVGTPEPRKNLPRLIEAMGILRQRGFSHRLLIVGGGGWGNVSLASAHVDLAGRVSDTVLHALYASAACLALPSLHEGFGLTAVEAMASGAPVVASNRGALPEITGGAAVIVDPLDSGAIALGIERAIAEGATLSAAGKGRAKLFRWEQAAASMARVYREVA